MLRLPLWVIIARRESKFELESGLLETQPSGPNFIAYVVGFVLSRVR